jgi:hypothetical protein
MAMRVLTQMVHSTPPTPTIPTKHVFRIRCLRVRAFSSAVSLGLPKSFDRCFDDDILLLLEMTRTSALEIHTLVTVTTGSASSLSLSSSSSNFFVVAHHHHHHHHHHLHVGAAAT